MSNLSKTLQNNSKVNNNNKNLLIVNSKSVNRNRISINENENTIEESKETSNINKPKNNGIAKVGNNVFYLSNTKPLRKHKVNSINGDKVTISTKGDYYGDTKKTVSKRNISKRIGFKNEDNVVMGETYKTRLGKGEAYVIDDTILGGKDGYKVYKLYDDTMKRIVGSISLKEFPEQNKLPKTKKLI